MQDPVEFAKRVLGFEPWERQAEIMRAVRDNPRVAVRSGHKIGKSAAEAALALWWFHTKPNALVVATCATEQQVKNIFWHELTLMYRRAQDRLGGTIFESPRTGLKHPDGRRILAFGTNKPENIAGYSGAELLFIVDEASGVEDAIFEAIEGNQAGGAHVAMFGNPTKQFGKFYDAFHSAKGFWDTHHVSSAESPNVAAGKMVVRGLANRKWMDEMREEYGEKSPVYLVRVLGEFPDQAEDAVIGLHLVEELFKRWRPVEPTDGRLEIGVDVARFGDDFTVIQPRRGLFAGQPTLLNGGDVPTVVQTVQTVAAQLRQPGERPLVKVDGCGVGGGVVDYLRMSNAIDVVDVNSGTGASGHEYARLRDQLWFNLRDWIAEGGSAPHDRLLEAELLAITYKFDVRNQLKVESKDDMRKKLKPRRSPDRADALALAVWCGAAAPASSSYDDPMAQRDYEFEDEFAAFVRRRIAEVQGG